MYIISPIKPIASNSLLSVAITNKPIKNNTSILRILPNNEIIKANLIISSSSNDKAITNEEIKRILLLLNKPIKNNISAILKSSTAEEGSVIFYIFTF